MPRIGVGLGIDLLRANGLDPSASAYFAATGITGATEQQAVNTLVTSLKSAGLWSKMKAVYPFVTDNRNLLSYTEDFGNGAWVKFSGASVTTNTASAPNGTNTADTLNSGTGIALYQVSSGSSDAIPYTASIYVKKIDFEVFRFGMTDDAAEEFSYNYNLDTLVVSAATTPSVWTNTSGTITSVGNGWYRLTVTGTKKAAGVARMVVRGQTTSKQYYLWGAQLELGSTASTYQPIATTQQSYISNQFKYNLVNPVDSDAAFRGVFNGGWTFSNQGATPNGTNGYMDTKLVPSSVLAQNSTHLSYYSRTNVVSGTSIDIGTATGVGGVGLRTYIIMSYGGLSYSNINSASDTLVTTLTDTRKFVLAYRNNSLNFVNQVNSTQQTLTSVSGGLSDKSFYIGAFNRNGVSDNYSQRQCAFSSIGDGLSDSEATALYNAVQTFNTSLTRQVA